MGKILLPEGSAASTPASGYGAIYVQTDGVWYIKDDGGNEYSISPANGTWTPTFFGTSTAGTFTYDSSNTIGYYTRLGNMVFVTARVTISAISVAPVGTMRIGGLPFTVRADSANNVPAYFGNITNLDYSATAIELIGFFISGTTTIDLRESFDNAAAVAFPAAQFTNAACGIMVGGWYRV